MLCPFIYIVILLSGPEFFRTANIASTELYYLIFRCKGICGTWSWHYHTCSDPDGTESNHAVPCTHSTTPSRRGSSCTTVQSYGRPFSSPRQGDSYSNLPGYVSCKVSRFPDLLNYLFHRHIAFGSYSVEFHNQFSFSCHSFAKQAKIQAHIFLIKFIFKKCIRISSLLAETILRTDMQDVRFHSSNG